MPKRSRCCGVSSAGDKKANHYLALVHETNSATAGFTIDVEKRQSFSEQDVRELVQSIFPEDLYTNSFEIQNRVLDFYLKDDSWSEKNHLFYLKKYTQASITTNFNYSFLLQIFSDLQFNVPIVWDILLRSNRRWPIYVYKSAYVNPGAMPESCPIKSKYLIS